MVNAVFMMQVVKMKQYIWCDGIRNARLLMYLLPVFFIIGNIRYVVMQLEMQHH